MIFKILSNKHGHSSCIVEYGHTHVLCTASYDYSVPVFLDSTQQGWISAEYSMLPHATSTRCNRSTTKPQGRSIEIQRLIGRTLRAACKLSHIPGLHIRVDCDVLQADAGTRVASINGAFVCLSKVVQKLLENKTILKTPITHSLCAVSCCIIDSEFIFHPTYGDDSIADADINLVFSHTKELIEIQASGEKGPMRIPSWDKFFQQSSKEIEPIIKAQISAISCK